jgi:hypothetical protein
LSTYLLVKEGNYGIERNSENYALPKNHSGFWPKRPPSLRSDSVKQRVRGNGPYVAIFLIVMLAIAAVDKVWADLDFSESVLDFGVITRPKTKSIPLVVANRSGSPFLGSVEIEKPWLTTTAKDLSLAAGKSTELIFNIDSSSLEPGDHEMHIYFKDLMGTSKGQVAVKCIVIEGKDDPILKVREKSIDYKEVERGAQPYETIWVENVGSGVLRGTVHYPEWLHGESELELHFTQVRPMYIRAYTNDFSPGEYTGEIRVESNGGDRTLPVKIKVRPKADDPILGFKPKEVDFGTVVKGKKGRIKVKVLNTGKGHLTGTVTYPEWIEGDEEFKEIEKDKEFLIVADTGKLPIGVTRDVIKLTTKVGLKDVPVKIYVKSRR